MGLATLSVWTGIGSREQTGKKDGVAVLYIDGGKDRSSSFR